LVGTSNDKIRDSNQVSLRKIAEEITRQNLVALRDFHVQHHHSAIVSSYDDAQHIMVPNQAPPTSATITFPLLPLTQSTTVSASNIRSVATDRSLLTPEDAIYQGSPPRKQSAAAADTANKLQKDLRMTNGASGDAARLPRRGRHKDRNRSGSRRRKGTWKKLLWVKQSCEPHNRTLEGSTAKTDRPG
jgi:hypothetical protein